MRFPARRPSRFRTRPAVLLAAGSLAFVACSDTPTEPDPVAPATTAATLNFIEDLPLPKCLVPAAPAARALL